MKFSELVLVEQICRNLSEAAVSSRRPQPESRPEPEPESEVDYDPRDPKKRKRAIAAEIFAYFTVYPPAKRTPSGKVMIPGAPRVWNWDATEGTNYIQVFGTERGTQKVGTGGGLVAGVRPWYWEGIPGLTQEDVDGQSEAYRAAESPWVQLISSKRGWIYEILRAVGINFYLETGHKASTGGVLRGGGFTAAGEPERITTEPEYSTAGHAARTDVRPGIDLQREIMIGLMPRDGAPPLGDSLPEIESNIAAILRKFEPTLPDGIFFTDPEMSAAESEESEREAALATPFGGEGLLSKYGTELREIGTQPSGVTFEFYARVSELARTSKEAEQLERIAASRSAKKTMPGRRSRARFDPISALENTIAIKETQWVDFVHELRGQELEGIDLEFLSPDANVFRSALLDAASNEFSREVADIESGENGMAELLANYELGPTEQSVEVIRQYDSILRGIEPEALLDKIKELSEGELRRRVEQKREDELRRGIEKQKRENTARGPSAASLRPDWFPDEDVIANYELGD